MPENIVIDDVKKKLLTMDQVRERFASTEPLAAISLRCGERNTKFKLRSEVNGSLVSWNTDIDTKHPDELVDAFITVGNTEFQLNKEAICALVGNVGLSVAYAIRTPAKFIEDQLNFWYGYGIVDKDYKLFVRNSEALAISRSTITPFSNNRFLDQMLASIEEKYGAGTIYADYKFQHTLKQTTLRLIVPESMRQINDTDEENDNWSVGVQLLHSLVGDSITSLDAYMFRYVCTNGLLDMHATAFPTTWNRKAGQDDTVYDWCRTAVDEVLGGLEHTLDKVQEMVYDNLEGDVVDITREIFKNYQVPGAIRDLVSNELIDTNNMTAYNVMNAFSAVANNSEIDPKHVLTLMQAAGAMPGLSHTRCTQCQTLTTSHD